MPFALSVIKGDADLSECTLLTEGEIRDLKNSITRSDWQEELIQSLRLKIKDVDLSALTGDLGGDYREGRLFINCLGREFEIFPGGDIQSGGILHNGSGFSCFTTSTHMEKQCFRGNGSPSANSEAVW